MYIIRQNLANRRVFDRSLHAGPDDPPASHRRARAAARIIARRGCYVNILRNRYARTISVGGFVAGRLVVAVYEPAKAR